jgi:hypothetical protein
MSGADAGDGSVAGDASDLRVVEVGTGMDTFLPLMTDQMVNFVIGPQGGGRYMGYHIWSAVRTHGYNPNGATVRITVLSATTGVVHASQTRIVQLEPHGADDIAYGIAARLDDCCAVAGRPILMHADVTDQDGNHGVDERRLLPEAVCPSPADPMVSICP